MAARLAWRGLSPGEALSCARRVVSLIGRDEAADPHFLVNHCMDKISLKNSRGPLRSVKGGSAGADAGRYFFRRLGGRKVVFSRLRYRKEML